mmetsp:Transcript_17613/g.38235  ORF Transcript_17613/g.38235 Transcript_17613/m.38235 type:complete len:89 (+) Transcript_17613:529-795(+)
MEEKRNAQHDPLFEVRISKVKNSKGRMPVPCTELGRWLTTSTSTKTKESQQKVVAVQKVDEGAKKIDFHISNSIWKFVLLSADEGLVM